MRRTSSTINVSSRAPITTPLPSGVHARLSACPRVPAAAVHRAPPTRVSHSRTERSVAPEASTVGDVAHQATASTAAGSAWPFNSSPRRTAPVGSTSHVRSEESLEPVAATPRGDHAREVTFFVCPKWVTGLAVDNARSKSVSAPSMLLIWRGQCSKRAPAASGDAGGYTGIFRRPSRPAAHCPPSHQSPVPTEISLCRPAALCGPVPQRDACGHIQTVRNARILRCAKS